MPSSWVPVTCMMPSMTTWKSQRPTKNSYTHTMLLLSLTTTAARNMVLPRRSPQVILTRRLQRILPTANETCNHHQLRMAVSTLYESILRPSLKVVYHTSDAMMYSGFVALVFVITSVIFISYDCLVQRRQNQVMTTAARANAIVDSLFPAMVRERVFQTNEPGTRGTGGRNSPSPDWNSPSGGGGGAVKGDTPKKRLRSFLQVNRRSSRKMKENGGSHVGSNRRSLSRNYNHVC